MKNNIITSIVLVALLATIFTGCQKDDQYLPPDWNYEIPQTELKAQTQIGAFYSNKTDINWSSPQGYTPQLNLVTDAENGTTDTVAYTSTQDGILTRQCEWADKAGIDFFIVDWNGGTNEQGLISAYEFYRTENTKVKVAINYNFSHLKLTSLTGEGTDFDSTVADFKSLYTTLFSKEWYYRMPDGRPIIIISGNTSTSYDYSLFIPAFRQAMKDFTQELQITDAEISNDILNFYFIGENTTNWCAPQTNEAAASLLNGNYVKQWYPTSYYERWACFYPFTDMAWQNWTDYSDKWGSDFIPCIYPEYYTTTTGSRSIERSTEGYKSFCNVAKRNVGANNIILIDSWNDFTHDTALEPTVEYGDTYLDITRSELKLGK